ncbi:hypothetical protein GBAR_LOCUS12111 [Geodia barretti]|uniref:Uncharacterized protein n=1 Tax=Geodia barretti TaxID=519541 RepID=A0AA35WG69_GEOBA|nr:hypothetical protein GBAR_LOCUS12111 [Geodia barretti]
MYTERADPVEVIKLTRRPAIGEKSLEFIHADIATC